jgi:HD-like signal output (HDOD) protein
MKPVLVASMNSAEAQEIGETINREYKVAFVESPKELLGHLGESGLVVLDSSFKEQYGEDFFKGVLKKSRLPVLMLTPPDDVKGAIQAMRAGASNYVVKVGDYHQVLNLSIQAALERFSQQEQMKQAITALKKQVDELERRPNVAGGQGAQTSFQETNILDEIVFVFKRGEINLPSPPHISIKFKEMIRDNANLQDIGRLLKQDMAISSKLISVSNSAYYRGVSENKTLEQAVGRLGFATTRQYVDAICNRSLYITKNKNFLEFMERLWEHSLSCAYATQVVCQMLRLKLSEDAFTLGLMHDIGKLLLLHAVGELQAKKKLGEDIETSDLFNTIDTYHGKFGGALLKRWKFPSTFCQVAIHHDHLQNANPISKELLVVNFSNLLVKSMGYCLAQQTEIDLEDAESARLLGLNSKRIAEAGDRAKGLMEDMKGYFN